MSLNIAEISNVGNVAAGARFSIEFPVGKRVYRNAVLELTNIGLTDMTDISLELHGKPVMQFDDLAQLKLLNDYYGRDDKTASGIHTLYFSRPEFLERWRDLTAIGTGDISTMILRGKLDAAVVNPDIKCHADYYVPDEDGRKRGEHLLGAITKVRSFPRTFATAGKQEIDSLPTGGRIMAMHLLKSDINDVEVEADGNKFYDASKTIGEAIQSREARVPQTASATHVDFVLEGDPSEALVTRGLNNLIVRMDLGTNGSATPLVEYLDGFEGI